MKLSKLAKLLALASIALLAICLIDSLVYQANPINGKFIQDMVACKNGIWLRYYWYRGKHNEQEWLAMLDRLNRHKIRYAYFHVLGVNPNGQLQYHQPLEAKQITTRVHNSCPKTMCLAWVYIPSNFYRTGVDLGNIETRKALHKEAKWLIEQCGFDGVQWDYEFAPNNNPDLITFLKESRALIPPEKHLSIATPMSYPFTLYGWSDDYFKKVAPFVNQIAVMSYDSFLCLPRAYGELIARQVVNVSNDAKLGNPDCKVILGLPTYEDKTFAHHAFCESLANSLRGFEKGLNDWCRLNKNSKTSKPENLEGVALFADYTTNDEEWTLFDRVLRK